jgi:hypothetical protein
MFLWSHKGQNGWFVTSKWILEPFSGLMKLYRTIFTIFLWSFPYFSIVFKKKPGWCHPPPTPTFLSPASPWAEQVAPGAASRGDDPPRWGLEFASYGKFHRKKWRITIDKEITW